MAATGISLSDKMKSGVVGWKTKNASCSELRGLPLLGWEDSSYICERLRGPWIASYGLQARTRLAIPFSTTAERCSLRFAQLTMACSNPTFAQSGCRAVTTGRAWRNWAGGEKGLIACNFFVTLTLANPFLPVKYPCSLLKFVIFPSLFHSNTVYSFT